MFLLTRSLHLLAITPFTHSMLHSPKNENYYCLEAEHSNYCVNLYAHSVNIRGVTKRNETLQIKVIFENLGPKN